MATKKLYPCVLTIAGSDSSGGAGIQADIKAISATGSYAASVITALTAQNTQGVQAIEAVATEFIKQQLKSVFDDLHIHAVKIGMLFNNDIIQVVANALTHYQPKYIVLDPVMVAKNGCLLLQSNTIDSLKINLFNLATLITPNLHEAETLLQQKIHNQADMKEAAKKLATEFACNVLLKGGHLPGDSAIDTLYHIATNSYRYFESQRVVTPNTHGTGCTLASTIASYLAQGYCLVTAIEHAKVYIFQALRAGSHYQLGHGHGPVNHFYHLVIPF